MEQVTDMKLVPCIDTTLNLGRVTFKQVFLAFYLYIIFFGFTQFLFCGLKKFPLNHWSLKFGLNSSEEECLYAREQGLKSPRYRHIKRLNLIDGYNPLAVIKRLNEILIFIFI